MSGTPHPGPPVPVPFSEGKPKRVLTRGTRACEQVLGSSSVNAVYPHAIEICGQLGVAKGMGVFGGLLVTGLTLMNLWVVSLIAMRGGRIPLTLSGWLVSVLGLAVSVATLGGAVWFFRKDLFTYRDEPVLFNRKTRKVHLFRRRINWKRPLSPWPVVIETYDWDCIRGEIHGGTHYNGSFFVTRFQLLLAVADKPRSKTVIDRFIVGSQGFSLVQMTHLWEHVRRYMENDGAPLQPGEQLNHDRVFSHAGAWAMAFPFLHRDAENRHSIALWAAAILAFPLTLTLSLCTWLAELSCRQPQWPQAILDDAGGRPLSDEKLRELVPPKSDTAMSDCEVDHSQESA
jgi:hypothetical protein